MRDAVLYLRRHDGFSIICNAKSRSVQHAKIIGAVADREGGGEFDAALIRQLVQRCDFGIPVQNRLADLAGERGAVIEQGVGAVDVKA